MVEIQSFAHSSSERRTAIDAWLKGGRLKSSLFLFGFVQFYYAFMEDIMKILKLTDLIDIKANDITVTISPISRKQKAEISSAVKMHAGKEIVDYELIALKTIQFSVKAIKGIKGYDNQPYQLEKDNEGNLTEDCAYELLGAFSSTQITKALSQSISGDLSEIDGVEFKVKSEKK